MERPHSRLSLHKELCDIIGAEDRVYFSAPVHMQYPCIRYDDNGDEVDYGDNTRYRMKRRWTITIIDQNPDSWIPAKLLNHFRYCSKDRVYATDGLYHFVFNLYY